jgi:hypothetical protein
LVGAFYTHESAPGSALYFIQDPATLKTVTTLFDELVQNKYSEYAGFADLTVHITDRFDVQIGGRESHGHESASAVFVGGGGLPEVKTDDNAFTYLLTPRWRISSDLMAYARLASGYRAGGPNNSPDTPPSFKPDKSLNYELGIKGGTAEVTLGNPLRAQALAQLDPSELILDIAGNLVLQGGIGPAGSLTSARIDAGGNLLITTHGPAAMQYTYTDTQFASRTLPGGVIMIGGGASGIFDAADVPLQGTGVPITINILNGGVLTRSFDFGRDDAVIQTGRNVFDQSLLNYLIFAANEAGARRIRRGSKDDDDDAGAACN